MKTHTLLTALLSLGLGLASTAASAGGCGREEMAMESAATVADAICSGPATPETLSACQFAFGAFMQAAATYEDCLRREDQTPR